MNTKGTTINFNHQKVYIGIDVHLKSWKVTILANEREHKTFSQDPCALILSNYLNRNFPGASFFSAYEAGFCGFSVHRELEACGINNIIVNPADIPSTDKEKKQKEDKRDSRKIARALKNQELNPIYVPTIEIEELRSLVRYRKTLVKEIARHKCRVKSLLYFSGIKIPLELNTASKYWSGKFTLWLKQLQFTTIHGKITLEDTLDTADILRKKLLNVNKHLRLLDTQGRYANILTLLKTIPGIGTITALTLLTELDDIDRFKKFDHLCSFVGFIPTTNSSGQKEKVGNITTRTNKALRNSIIEAAWIASRLDPSLAYSYSILLQRMNPNQAVIRIAKKLLNRIRYVMINKLEYVHAVI